MIQKDNLHLILASIAVFLGVWIHTPQLEKIWHGVESKPNDTILSSEILSALTLMRIQTPTVKIQKDRKELTKSRSRSRSKVENLLDFFNPLGQPGAFFPFGTTWSKILSLRIREENRNDTESILPQLVQVQNIYKIHMKNRNRNRVKSGREVMKMTKKRINVASVICGSGGNIKEVKMQIKSLVMVSWDSELNLILFGDEKSFPVILPWLLDLKWTVDELHSGFTFELHPVSFPSEVDARGKVDSPWRNLFAPCASQRLFLSSLLGHVDSLIYLDTDSILISNLTEFWLEFDKMDEKALVAMTTHNEMPSNGFYNLKKHVPFFGPRGLQSGVMLMNLTRMRDFDFENRIRGAYAIYREKLESHDQDLLNILFNVHPDRVHVLSCIYNFLDLHCGQKDGRCEFEMEVGPKCFCQDALENGVRLVQGTQDLFLNDYELLDKPVDISHSASIFRFLYKTIKKFDLIHDSTSKLAEDLISGFNSLQRPCYNLTGEQMYSNIKRYFLNLAKQAKNIRKP